MSTTVSDEHGVALPEQGDEVELWEPEKAYEKYVELEQMLRNSKTIDTSSSPRYTT